MHKWRLLNFRNFWPPPSPGQYLSYFLVPPCISDVIFGCNPPHYNLRECGSKNMNLTAHRWYWWGGRWSYCRSHTPKERCLHLLSGYSYEFPIWRQNQTSFPPSPMSVWSYFELPLTLPPRADVICACPLSKGKPNYLFKICLGQNG